MERDIVHVLEVRTNFVNAARQTGFDVVRLQVSCAAVVRVGGGEEDAAIPVGRETEAFSIGWYAWA